MNTTIVTPPTLEPVTVALAKDYLRVTDDNQDRVISLLIHAARLAAEQFTGRAFMTQTWNGYLNGFADPIRVPYPPLASATITYYDATGTLGTLDAGTYTVDTNAVPGRIHLAYGQSWPSTRAIPNAVIVQFVCGYGAADYLIPDPIRTAILLMAGHLYEHRETVVVGLSVQEMPQSARSLLWQYRVWGAE